MSKRGPNQVIAVLVALVAIISVAVVVISLNRPVTDFDKSSPEGVVQSYLRAVLENDYDEAENYLETNTKCETSDLDRAYRANNIRVDLIETEITAEIARVKIQIEYPSGALLNNYYTEEQVFRLVTESAQWKITGIPWPLYDCGSSSR